ncbi:TPA: alpha-galactosidase [Candidatus Sumerlaeota bacterium]|nr:alpha-galactosidase [Candidatus Sumerlaeota bacterium]
MKRQIFKMLGALLTGATLLVPSIYAEEKASTAATPPAYHAFAPTPPMGWNSWDRFGTSITEAQAQAQADAQEKLLLPHGWKYFVVDIQWYEPRGDGFGYHKGAVLTMDEYGRLLPAPNRFPSAADDKGFKPLAKYVHDKGMKFGVHLMRGIPRQAVTSNTLVLGTQYHAQDIVTTQSKCAWNPDMYGVNMSKPGAQEYYNSVFTLLASWDIDFVKVDDISRPYDKIQKAEIEAIRKAIDKTGRPMVLSLSPGDTPLKEGAHVNQQANMWRISDDFWDKWKPLEEQFKRLSNWAAYRQAGAWPDADMLPLGTLDMGKRKTNFKPAEQKTMMTLWSIARSPLILGADMTKLDDATLALLTNDEVIAVNQKSDNNRQLFRTDAGQIAWVADVPGSKDKYVALFNTGTETTSVTLPLADIGFKGSVQVRDLWEKKDLEKVKDAFSPDIPSHGAGLYRVAQ